MKKIDAMYVFTWYGVLALLVIAAFVAAGLTTNIVVLLAGVVLVVVGFLFIAKRMDKTWLQNAEAMEKNLTFQYKFTSNSGIFYIDQGGGLGIVWKYNPTQLFHADLNQVSNIRTHDGKQLGGTALVSCQFTLAGKRYKIYTLRVSNGQLPMNSPKVIEAIAKANDLCAMLATAQQNAAGRTLAGAQGQ